MRGRNAPPSGSGENLALDPRKDFPEHDRAVRNWFTVRLRPVTETFGYSHAEIYAWRHRSARAAYTLHVTREVLDRNDGRLLPDLLEERDAESALRAFPDGNAVLRYVDGRLLLQHFPPPKG